MNKYPFNNLNISNIFKCLKKVENIFFLELKKLPYKLIKSIRNYDQKQLIKISEFIKSNR